MTFPAHLQAHRDNTDVVVTVVHGPGAITTHTVTPAMPYTRNVDGREVRATLNATSLSVDVVATGEEPVSCTISLADIPATGRSSVKYLKAAAGAGPATAPTAGARRGVRTFAAAEITSDANTDTTAAGAVHGPTAPAPVVLAEPVHVLLDTIATEHNLHHDGALRWCPKAVCSTAYRLRP